MLETIAEGPDDGASPNENTLSLEARVLGFLANHETLVVAGVAVGAYSLFNFVRVPFWGPLDPHWKEYIRTFELGVLSWTFASIYYQKAVSFLSPKEKHRDIFKFIARHSYVSGMIASSPVLLPRIVNDVRLAGRGAPLLTLGIYAFDYMIISNAVWWFSMLLSEFVKNDALSFNRNMWLLSRFMKTHDRRYYERGMELIERTKAPWKIPRKAAYLREDGRMDEAIEVLQTYFESQPIPYMNLLTPHIIRTFGNFVVLSTMAMHPKKHKADLFHTITQNLTITGSPRRTLNLFRFGRAFFRDDLEFNLIYSLFLEKFFGDSGFTREQWQRTLALILNEPMETYQIAETVNLVWGVDPEQHPFFSRSYLFKQNELEELKAEVRLGDILREWTSQRRDVGVVNVLMPPAVYETRDGKKTVLGMIREPGKTLYELITTEGLEKHKAIIQKAAELTGLCHGVTPLGASSKGAIELRTKAYAKLGNRGFLEGLIQGGMSPEEAEGLRALMLEYLRPVFETAQTSVKGVNFDSHPQQFIVSSRLIRADTEDKGIVPIAMDFANLFMYFRLDDSLLGVSEIEGLVEAYINSYNPYLKESQGVREFKKRGVKDPEAFLMQSLVLGLERSVSLTVAWSSPQRRSMWDNRAGMLKNGMDAIELVGTRFQAHFAVYGNEYEGLYASFERMAKCLAIQ